MGWPDASPWTQPLGPEPDAVTRSPAYPCRGRLRCLDDPPDQLVEPDPGGVGRLRQQARLGQARDRVGLEHVKLVGPGLEHQVDAREP